MYTLTTKKPVSGEAAEHLIHERLRARGCIITESVMLPMVNHSGWMYGISIRRPRWLSRLFGFRKEVHLSITANHGRSGDATYDIGCMRTDREGGYSQWTRSGLKSLLASL